MDTSETIKVTSPAQVAAYLMEQVFTPFQAFEQEEFWMFPLNARYRITHQIMQYRGTINGIEMRPAEIFRTALRLNAYSLLVAHNHPSGCADASAEDLRFHRALCQVGDLLGIEVTDHIIVGDGEWQSLRQLYGKPEKLYPFKLPF